MNSKEKYIEELKAVKAPQELREKLAQLEKTEAKPKKKHTAQMVAAVAACLAFLVAAVPAIGTMQTKSSDKFASDNNAGFYDEAYLQEACQTTLVDKNNSGYAKDKVQAPGSPAESQKVSDDRKIIRHADISLEVRSVDSYIKSVRTSAENFGGYIAYESTSSSDDEKSSYLTVNVPADKLDSFLEYVETLGNITVRNVGADDVTDSYIDTQSRIKSLETELESLMKILEKAEDLDSIIKVQERISEVRADLESYKSQLKAMEGQITYSQVTLTATEQSHAVKTDGSLGSRIRERFTDSIYALVDFFSSFVVAFVGSLPIIAVIAVAATVIIVIIKKREKKKKEK